MRRSVQATLSRSLRQSTRPWPKYTQSQRRWYAERLVVPTVEVCPEPSDAAKLTLPTVELCPEPSCECRPTPEGLDIDHALPMVKPFYDEHVIVATGTSEWSSRLEADDEAGAAYEALRFFLNVTNRPNGSRRFGEFHNPAHTVLVTNSSFQPTHVPKFPSEGGEWERRPTRLSFTRDVTDGGRQIQTQKHEVLSIPRLERNKNGIQNRTFLPPTARAPTTPTSIYTFPSGKYVTIPIAPDVQTFYSYIRRFVKNFVAPQTVHPELAEMAALAGDEGLVDHLQRGQEYNLNQSSVMDVVILICGHGNRDARCGTMGPLLQAEFEDKLPKFNVKVLEGKSGKIPRDMKPYSKENITQKHVETPATARVGLVSHIGGHKWAGNVIIYFPNWYRGHPLAKHPLRGKGIWYGRVEPWHVEGIIEQTIMGGTIIRELFRGGMPGVRLQGDGELVVEQEEHEYDPKEPDALSELERRV